MPSGSGNTTCNLARPDADPVFSEDTEHKVRADGGQRVLVPILLDAADDPLTRSLLWACVHPREEDAEDEAVDDQENLCAGLLPPDPRVAVAAAEERRHIVTLTE